jgi:hypothetical protein
LRGVAHIRKNIKDVYIVDYKEQATTDSADDTTLITKPADMAQ